MTDSRGGTGRQDEALRPEQVRERGERTKRDGERDAGGQPAMRMLRLSAAECVRVCLCVCACTRKSVCVSKGKKKRAALSPACVLCCYLAG